MSNCRFITYMNSPDRNVRKVAFESMYKAYGQFKNTLATTLGTKSKKQAFTPKSENITVL